MPRVGQHPSLHRISAWLKSRLQASPDIFLNRRRGRAARLSHNVPQLEETHLDKYVLDPDSSACTCWFAMLFCAICYNAFSIPFQIALLPAVDPSTMWWSLNWLTDVILILDIGVSLNRGFWTHQGSIKVLSRQEIRRRYLRNVHSLTRPSLCRDLMSVLPLHLLVLMHMPVGNLHGWLRANRLIRTPRLFSLLHELFPPKRKQLVRMIEITICFAVLAHNIACGWLLFGRLDGFGTNEWLPSAELAAQSLGRQYLESLHHALGMMTGVAESGEPSTEVHALFHVLSMVGSLLIFAFAIGVVSAGEEATNQQAMLFQARISYAMLVLRNHSLPDELVQRVKAYLTHQNTHGSSTDLSLLHELPEALQGDLTMHIVGRYFAKVHLFHEAARTEGFIGILSSKLTVAVFMVEECLVDEGVVNQLLLYISRGEAVRVATATSAAHEPTEEKASGAFDQFNTEIQGRGYRGRRSSKETAMVRVLEVLGAGEVCGEDSLFKTTALASIIATAPCECFALDQADLAATLKHFPEVKDAIESAADRDGIRRQRRQSEQLQFSSFPHIQPLKAPEMLERITDGSEAALSDEPDQLRSSNGLIDALRTSGMRRVAAAAAAAAAAVAAATAAPTGDDNKPLLNVSVPADSDAACTHGIRGDGVGWHETDPPSPPIAPPVPPGSRRCSHSTTASQSPPASRRPSGSKPTEQQLFSLIRDYALKEKNGSPAESAGASPNASSNPSRRGSHSSDRHVQKISRESPVRRESPTRRPSLDKGRDELVVLATNSSPPMKSIRGNSNRVAPAPPAMSAPPSPPSEPEIQLEEQDGGIISSRALGRQPGSRLQLHTSRPEEMPTPRAHRRCSREVQPGVQMPWQWSSHHNGSWRSSLIWQPRSAMGLAKGLTEPNDGVFRVPLIDPSSRLRSTWIVLALACSLYAGFSLSFRMGFRPWLTTNTDEALDALCDTILVIDLLAHTRLAFWKHAELVTDNHAILKRYAATLLPLNLICILPVFPCLVNGYRSACWWRAPLLLRLFCVPGLISELWKLHAPSNFTSRKLSIVTYSFAAMAHMCACLYSMVPHLESGDTLAAGNETSDLEGAYLHALWWSVTALTGSGSVRTPETSPQLAVAILVLICSFVTAIYIIGVMGVLINNLDAVGVTFQRRIAATDEFVQQQGLTTELAERLCRYQRCAWTGGAGCNLEVVVQQVNQSIRADIMKHICLSTFVKVPLFESCGTKFIEALMGAIGLEIFPQNEWICHKGSISTTLCIILSGTVSIVIDEARMIVVRRLAVGDFFGERSLFGDEKRNASIRAGWTTVKLVMLEAAAFRKVLASWPGVKQSIIEAKERREAETEAAKKAAKVLGISQDSTTMANAGIMNKLRRVSERGKERRSSNADSFCARKASAASKAYA